jgi:hypothetical protein
MKRIMVLALSLFATAAFAQTCDVVYSVDVTMTDPAGVEHNVIGPAVLPVYGLPMADVLDNSEHGLKVVKMIGQADGKGGPYMIEVGEVRACDGKPPEKVLANSIMAKGVTLKDSNKIQRESLKQQEDILKRYEKRAEKGDRHGWDHAKANKAKRNDLGQHVKE